MSDEICLENREIIPTFENTFCDNGASSVPFYASGWLHPSPGLFSSLQKYVIKRNCTNKFFHILSTSFILKFVNFFLQYVWKIQTNVVPLHSVRRLRLRIIY